MRAIHNFAGLAVICADVFAYSFAPPSPPTLTPHPRSPANFQVPSGDKDPSKVCVVSSSQTDAAPSILAAAQQCNKGGTVYFPVGEYVISTALDLTFLDNIDFAILGTISFNDNVKIWPNQTFHYSYQSTSMFWRFGGKDVNIYGLGQGVIDGRGQTYWTAMQSDASLERPILFGTDGLHRATISGLKMKNPPNWFNLIANSTDILISDMDLDVIVTNTSSPAKNTDGWDTFRSSNVVIQDSVIVNTDDCVSFKPNSTHVIVQNLQCTGSHGISVGSLGQYQGQVDIVEDIYVYNVTMTNAGDFARIKVWPGVPPGTTGSSSGGGTGRASNITYELLHSINNDRKLRISPDPANRLTKEDAITLTQCYFAANQSMCNQYPSELVIENVLFKDFWGTTSKKYDPQVGSLICSNGLVCHDIAAQNITVLPASNKNATYTCVNMDTSKLDINCT